MSTWHLVPLVPTRAETYAITKSLSGQASPADIRTKHLKNTFRSIAAWTNLYLDNSLKHTIQLNQHYSQRAFATTPMTANTTDGMYPRLVSIFCYGFLTRVWCYLYISTDPQYIGVPLQTLKTYHHAGNTKTANIAREQTYHTHTHKQHETTDERNATEQNTITTRHLYSQRSLPCYDVMPSPLCVPSHWPIRQCESRRAYFRL
jgi:hypothetical protein